MTALLTRRKALIGIGGLIATPVIVRADSLMKIRGERLIIEPAVLHPPILGAYYKLDGRTPVRVYDLLEWAGAMEGPRHVSQSQVGDVEISTVFLGIDHSFGNTDVRYAKGEKLVLFETMVFGGPLDRHQVRYSDYGDAESGHNAIVARVRAAIDANARMLASAVRTVAKMKDEDDA